MKKYGFWQSFYDRCSPIGEDQRVLALRNDSQVMQLQSIARILVKGYLHVNYFPFLISNVSITSMLFREGSVVEENPHFEHTTPGICTLSIISLPGIRPPTGNLTPGICPPSTHARQQEKNSQYLSKNFVNILRKISKTSFEKFPLRRATKKMKILKQSFR